MALSIFNQFHKQGPKAIETAAEALAKHITTSTNQQDALASTQWDILNFSYKNPQAIDYLLRVYYHMSNILPPEVKNYYGAGGDAARRSLAMFFQQQVRSLNPYVEPEDVGETVVERDWDYDGTEYANATFTRDEVAGGLDKVLDKIRNVRDQRMKTVVAWTVEARAHALGVAKAGTGEQAHLPMHFSGLLKPASLGHNTISPWSKADFISGCVGLRAAAKSYLDECTVENREALIKTWKADVAEFLLDGDQAADDKHKKFRDGDFHIKYHSALLLDNLINGPRDETSEDLFSTEKWIL
ncbi:hypothetical protein SUNI508_10643 [Seiridium unicorne]|uniref:Uncharacterized protein n=1 Tax=Seiridium unicorne TaxID=138068 RepID=A0ABR2UKA1_9PEZI